MRLLIPLMLLLQLTGVVELVAPCDDDACLSGCPDEGNCPPDCDNCVCAHAGTVGLTPLRNELEVLAVFTAPAHASIERPAELLLGADIFQPPRA